MKTTPMVLQGKRIFQTYWQGKYAYLFIFLTISLSIWPSLYVSIMM